MDQETIQSIIKKDLIKIIEDFSKLYQIDDVESKLTNEMTQNIDKAVAIMEDVLDEYLSKYNILPEEYKDLQ